MLSSRFALQLAALLSSALCPSMLDAQVDKGCESNNQVSLGQSPEAWFMLRESHKTAVANALRLTAYAPASPDTAPVPREFVRMWKSDSIGLEWTLAELIADDYDTAARDAASAASLYRRLANTATPVLQRLLANRSAPARWDLAFRAITRLADPEERRVVAEFICLTEVLLSRIDSAPGIAEHEAFNQLAVQLRRSASAARALLEDPSHKRNSSRGRHR